MRVYGSYYNWYYLLKMLTVEMEDMFATNRIFEKVTLSLVSPAFQSRHLGYLWVKINTRTSS